MDNHYDSFRFSHGEREFEARIYYDDSSREPWTDSDGHGPVSEWVRRENKPGEWTLCEDHGMRRYYDSVEANAIARHDGWCLTDEHKTELLTRLCAPVRKAKTIAETVRNGIRHRVVTEWETVQRRAPGVPLTAGEIRAESVRRDYEFLRGWCNGDWHYCGVSVCALDDNGKPINDEFAHAIWGIESNADEYIREVAADLAGELCIALKVAEAESARRVNALRAAWDALAMVEHGPAIPATIDAIRAGLDVAAGPGDPRDIECPHGRGFACSVCYPRAK